jgi:hypothetical protein
MAGRLVESLGKTLLDVSRRTGGVDPDIGRYRSRHCSAEHRNRNETSNNSDADAGSAGHAVSR